MIRPRYHGVVRGLVLGTDRVLETGTVLCPHCGLPFEIGPDKTKGRGWCFKCAAYICGAKCKTCVPWEQQMENLEAGRPQMEKRIIVPGGFES